LAQAKTFSADKEAEAIAHAKEKGLPLAYINKKWAAWGPSAAARAAALKMMSRKVVFIEKGYFEVPADKRNPLHVGTIQSRKVKKSFISPVVIFTSADGAHSLGVMHSPDMKQQQMFQKILDANDSYLEDGTSEIAQPVPFWFHKKGGRPGTFKAYHDETLYVKPPKGKKILKFKKGELSLESITLAENMQAAYGEAKLNALIEKELASLQRPEVEEWNSSDGKAIQATFVSLDEGGKLTLSIPQARGEAKSVAAPLSRFSEDSQKQAEAWKDVLKQQAAQEKKIRANALQLLLKGRERLDLQISKRFFLREESLFSLARTPAIAVICAEGSVSLLQLAFCFFPDRGGFSDHPHLDNERGEAEAEEEPFVLLSVVADVKHHGEGWEDEHENPRDDGEEDREATAAEPESDDEESETSKELVHRAKEGPKEEASWSGGSA